MRPHTDPPDARPPGNLAVNVPGKINLTLRVIGRRGDGFHALDSVVCGVGVYDTLRARPRDDGRIVVRCDRADLAGPDNLAHRAASLLAEYAASPSAESDASSGSSPPYEPRTSVRAGFQNRANPSPPQSPPSDAPTDPPATAVDSGHTPPPETARNRHVEPTPAPSQHHGRPAFGVEIDLTKRIPVGAGMGGGSADAAVALMLCNRLWGLGLSRGEMAAIGARIGSDVPLFFSLPACRITGRGEHVEPLTLRWSGWVVLIGVDAVVPTGPVYAAHDAIVGADQNDASEPASPSPVDDLVRCSTSAAISRYLMNDLEPAVFRVCPRVGEVFRAIRALGFQHVRVTGAGSTLFVLADDAESAGEVEQRILDAELGVRVTPVRVVTTPLALQCEE